MSAAYLAIEPFLKTEIEARALDLALKTGLIDRLRASPQTTDDIPLRTRTGRETLARLLASNNVIASEGRDHRLSQAFRQVLPFRDLIEAKIAFTDLIVGDVSSLFPCLLDDIQQFMARSQVFQLFRYDRCFDATAENVAATRSWVAFTTALTRYEGEAFAAVFGIGDASTMLDVGGNSGEFAKQLCRVNPALRATVFDLPVVCRIGREHLAASAEAGRITFHAGDMRRDPLPSRFDLVTFKSVLHDWPERDARALVAKAAQSVAPGGRLVIFERAPMRLLGPVPYSQMSNLVFLHFFRPADLYVAALEEAGFQTQVDTLHLETEFHLISARRKG